MWPHTSEHKEINQQLISLAHKEQTGRKTQLTLCLTILLAIWTRRTLEKMKHCYRRYNKRKQNRMSDPPEAGRQSMEAIQITERKRGCTLDSKAQNLKVLFTVYWYFPCFCCWLLLYVCTKNSTLILGWQYTILIHLYRMCLSFFRVWSACLQRVFVVLVLFKKKERKKVSMVKLL